MGTIISKRTPIYTNICMFLVLVCIFYSFIISELLFFMYCFNFISLFQRFPQLYSAQACYFYEQSYKTFKVLDFELLYIFQQFVLVMLQF